jgi:Phage tail tube protein, GTA-gp10
VTNKQRGEVDVTGRDGRVYRFRLGTGALCALEETLDLDVMALFERLQQGKIRLRMVREFVKAAYISENGSGALTDPGANELIDNVGVVPVLDAMTDSILATFNIRKKNEEPEVPPDVTAPPPPAPIKKRGRPAGSGTLKPAAS